MKNHKLNPGAFVVSLSVEDPNLFYKKQILEIAEQAGLKISYDGMPKGGGKTLNRGVKHAGVGSTLTFGTVSYCDVEWVARNGYVAEKGYVPVYDSVKDYNKIVDAIAALYEARYGKIDLSSGYAKVDGDKVVIFTPGGTRKATLTSSDLSALRDALSN